MDDRFNTYGNFMKYSDLYTNNGFYIDYDDKLDEIREQLTNLYEILHNPSTIEDKFGSKIAEIINLVDEVNRDVLNNSSIYKFNLCINHKDYSYYLTSNEKVEIRDVSIDFIENPGYTRTVSIIYKYENFDRLTRGNVLDWMMSVIFKEDLSC